MAEEPDVIRQHIDQTRSSLTEKLETLEGQVRGTVQGAKATVEDTISTVRATVHDTVESVKRTFDLKYQVEQHPWPMVGGSVVAGFVVGSLIPSREGIVSNGTTHRASEGTRGAAWTAPAGASAYRPSETARTPPPSAPAEPGLLDRFLGQFEDEIRQVKGVAVGAAMGLLRDLAKQYVPPQLGEQVEQIIDSATMKLGGKPIPGPITEAPLMDMWRSRREG